MSYPVYIANDDAFLTKEAQILPERHWQCHVPGGDSLRPKALRPARGAC